MITRRRALGLVGIGGGSLLLGACDALNRSPSFRSLLQSGEGLNRRAQRLIGARDSLAREYDLTDLSPVFRSNGNSNPATPEYGQLAANRFADWRLVVDGLVQRPLSLSLAQVQQLPRRTQVTRHDCVEGWSAIGQWTGGLLGPLLDAASPRDDARFVVFHCMDRFGDLPYYESIDLVDAYHPQTILAYALNGQSLPVQNGAPLRLRVERQLGYKQAKYIQRIELRSTLDGLYGGKGGLWEDTTDYEWYAGI